MQWTKRIHPRARAVDWSRLFSIRQTKRAQALRMARATGRRRCRPFPLPSVCSADEDSGARLESADTQPFFYPSTQLKLWFKAPTAELTVGARQRGTVPPAMAPLKSNPTTRTNIVAMTQQKSLHCKRIACFMQYILMNGSQVLHQHRLLTNAQSQRDGILLQKKERKLTHYKHVFKSGNYATINDRIDQGAQAAICLTVMVSKGPGDSLLQQCKRHGL
jgi:hypothetical protein